MKKWYKSHEEFKKELEADPEYQRWTNSLVGRFYNVWWEIEFQLKMLWGWLTKEIEITPLIRAFMMTLFTTGFFVLVILLVIGIAKQ